jgi:sugar-specific transcriptional regulator TrmB
MLNARSLYPTDKETKILQELGLTFTQAKTYLFLSRTGKQKAMTISRGINSDRANIYQVLAQLQKIGLIQKILGKPILFEAVPMRQGILTLLQRRQKEYIKVQKEAEELLQQTPGKEKTPQIITGEFKIIQLSRETEKKQIAQSCDAAQKSWDLLLNTKNFLDGMINMPEPHVKCMKRGVKYRVIVEKTDLKPILKPLQKLMAELNFQIRYVSPPTPIVMGIMDRKAVSTALLSDKGIGERPLLQLDHAGCIEVFQVYFDSLWNQAREYKLTNISRRRKREQTVTS